MSNLSGEAMSSMRFLQLLASLLTPIVSMTLIHKALSKMKYGKAAGLSGIIAKMLKAAGEEGVELVRKLTEAIFSCGVIPSDREENFILNLYKGKGEVLARGNYRGHQLKDQAMKLMERVLDTCIIEM